ncbi:aminoglycoside phosphotransferase family protein [uncultured Tateyamaria sp.]|uniref:aminoglycoside phosphotransferase family protein n=1 Tax=uncultured Tateyamaria sp. TaxID=455651 RepID=UPI00260A462C|nr:aminoglycoside phosphotransferase family protein [uncultured Tateyamaria sp.]
MNVKIDGSLVSNLIANQFPDLGSLPVMAIKKQGHDNRTFRLGDELTVRLPSHPSYADAVQKEATALEALEGHLSVAVPKVFGLGGPCDAYPLPWSIRYWLAGETWENTQVLDKNSLARSLAEILVELRSAPADISLSAGKHSFYRGCHPSVYSDEVMECLKRMGDPSKAKQCLKVWQRGMVSAWSVDPVWFHGDVAVGNVLMKGDVVSALIDFGACGVGDPACDLTIAWTYFDAAARQHFREAVKVDDDTWYRARAWGLWKALVSIYGLSSSDTEGVQARALSEILNDDT